MGDIEDLVEDFGWAPWIDLRDAWKNPLVRREAGLYRIRCRGMEHLDYIGQTGRGNTLRGRLSNLAHVFRNEMPYRDPHTAGPALWARLQTDGRDLEVSFREVRASDQYRKGLECLAVSLHRMKYGFSPTFNFGRMPDDYTMSSARRHARRGAFSEGSRSVPSVEPFGPLAGDVQGAAWNGLDWMPWGPMAHASGFRAGKGVYRIRGLENIGLRYVGQGLIRQRMLAHQRSTVAASPYGAVIGSGANVEISAAYLDGLVGPQLLEVETDLIAAHMLVVGEPPTAQFLSQAVPKAEATVPPEPAS